MNNFLYIKFLNYFIEDLKYNSKNIENAAIIDMNHTNLYFNFSDFLEKINSYKDIKNSQCDSLNNVEIDPKVTNIFIYNGNPYLTIEYVLYSILNDIKIVLFYEDFYLALNTIIIKIIKNILKDMKIKTIIEFKEINTYDLNVSVVGYDNKNNVANVVGSSYLYEMLDFSNKTFVPYYNIILVSNETEFEDLKNLIFNYCYENRYQIEIISMDYFREKKDFFEYINSDKYSNIVILLTNMQSKIDEFLNNIHGKKLYINENPFKKNRR